PRRLGGQERDSDRRIRAARGRAGLERGRGCGARGAHAAASDPDDVVCVHPRRYPARGRDRRRGRDEAIARDGGVCGDAGSDWLRPAVYAGLLHGRSPAPWRTAGSSQKADDNFSNTRIGKPCRMRKSKLEAAETRRRIVKTAAAEFRRKGIRSTGLSDVMATAGLTHGGFYRHFASKDELVAEACAAAMQSLDETAEAAAC